MFGQQINLLIKKRTTYNSSLGAIVSIWIIGFTMLSFIQLTNDMTQRKNPNIINTVTVNSESKLFEFTPDNYMIYIDFLDQSNVPIFNQKLKTYFEVIFNVNRPKKEPGINEDNWQEQIKINGIPCQENIIPSKVAKEIDHFKYDLFGSYCPNYTQWKNTPLPLGYGSQFSIEIRKCINNTNKTFICAPQEKIDQIFDGSKIWVSFLDKLLDQYLFGNPFNSYIKILEFPFSGRNTTKQVQVFLQPVMMKTIDNLFYNFQDEIIQTELIYESFQENLQISVHNLYEVQITFYQSDNKINYYRTYRNLFDILGNISGLFQCQLFLFRLLINPLTKRQMNLDIINKIFSFDQLKKKESKMNKIVPKLQKAQNTRVVEAMRNIYDLDNKKTDNYLKDFFKQKKRKLKLNCFEQLTSIFKGYKKEQISFAFDKMIQKIDLIYIMKKLIEIDKLKVLLLTQDQLRLFDYLPKPTIKIKNQQESCFDQNGQLIIDYFRDDKPFKMQLRDVFESYKRIIAELTDAENKNNHINEKLINILDLQMRNIFCLTLTIQDQNLLENNDDDMLSPNQKKQEHLDFSQQVRQEQPIQIQ